MTRSEFLQQLQTTLENEVSSSVVQENVNYYNQYIDEEVRKGKSEEEVLKMLGEPWVLARTIIDAQPHSYASGYGQTEQDATQQSAPASGSVDGWWKKLLLILVVVMVIVLAISLVSGVVRLLAPILVPALIILIVIRIFTNRR